MELRPYQELALDAVRARKVPRGVLAMATGVGKSVVAARLPEAGGWGRVLYLAHREELISQLAEHVARVVGKDRVGVEMAASRAPDFAPFVIASVPTLQGRRLEAMSADRFDAIVIDECHHAPAPSYRAILRHFGILADDDSKVEAPACELIGLTATPGRGDGIGLNVVFDDILYRYAIADAIRDGWLVPIHAYTVRTKTSLDDVKVRAGEYVESDLARAVMSSERNGAIFDAHQQHARGMKTLVFAVNVAHAEELAAWFQDRGVEAQHVAGTFSPDDRRRTLNWFRRTPGAVLCNVALITEGVDIPSVEAVVLGRPTKSATVLAQAIGRGTRLADGARDYPDSVARGKDRCTVLDVCDSVTRIGRRAVRIGDLFGLPLPDADLDGQDILELGKEQQEQLELAQRQRVDTAAQVVDLFAKDEIPECCTLRWHPYGLGVWISLPTGWTCRIDRDTLDRWIVERRRPMSATWEVVERADSLEEAVAWAEERLTLDPERRALLDRDARWRRWKPSEKQLARAKRLGIVVPPDATMGDVSDAFDRHEAQQVVKPVSRKQRYAARSHGIVIPAGASSRDVARLLRKHGAFDGSCACERTKTEARPRVAS